MADLDSFLRSYAAKCVEHYVTTRRGDQPLHPIPLCIHIAYKGKGLQNLYCVCLVFGEANDLSPAELRGEGY